METWLFIVVVYLGWPTQPDPKVNVSVYISQQNCLDRKKEFTVYAEGKKEYLWWDCVKKPYDQLERRNDDGSRSKTLSHDEVELRSSEVYGLAMERISNVQQRGSTDIGEGLLWDDHKSPSR